MYKPLCKSKNAAVLFLFRWVPVLFSAWRAIVPLSLPIQLDGLLLRKFRSPDAPALAEIEFDPDVKRYLAVPGRSKDDWIESVRIDGIRGVVIETDVGQVAGCASIDQAKRRGDGELRIVIGKPFWGNAFGTKVAKALIQAAFEQMSAKAIIGVVHPKNVASLRLLRSFKFRRRGVVTNLEPSWQHGHYVYRLTKGAYDRGNLVK
jgi:[ribosomal protein S5]-alanine N-acetyltransferase